MGNHESKGIQGGTAWSTPGGVMSINDALEEAVFDEDELNMWYKQFMKVINIT